MTIKERSLLEKPVLFVQEGENMWPYQRRYTDSGLPYYSPPVEKNNSEETKILEVLFIPISNEDFDNDKENYFGKSRDLLGREIRNLPLRLGFLSLVLIAQLSLLKL